MTFDLDLVVLVADADQREAIGAILDRRTDSVGMRTIRYKPLKHPHRDPGCLRECADVLHTFLDDAHHALVIFDLEGCGRDDLSARDVEEEVRRKLGASGWNDRADAVVIDPEIERWVWSESPHVPQILGWKGTAADLRSWLASRGAWPASDPKPPRPKEALRAVLRETQVRPSASLFGDLARNVGFKSCSDPSFVRLIGLLSTWFPAPASRLHTPPNSANL